jgi:hypothetical protein
MSVPLVFDFIPLAVLETEAIWTNKGRVEWPNCCVPPPSIRVMKPGFDLTSVPVRRASGIYLCQLFEDLLWIHVRTIHDVNGHAYLGLGIGNESCTAVCGCTGCIIICRDRGRTLLEHFSISLHSHFRIPLLDGVEVSPKPFFAKVFEVMGRE